MTGSAWVLLVTGCDSTARRVGQRLASIWWAEHRLGEAADAARRLPRKIIEEAASVRLALAESAERGC